MQHIQEKLQLKDGHLRNVTIAAHKFKVYLCMNVVARVYEVCLKNIMMHYQKTNVKLYLPRVKLLRMYGESKSGLSTYYI